MKSATFSMPSNESQYWIYLVKLYVETNWKVIARVTHHTFSSFFFEKSLIILEQAIRCYECGVKVRIFSESVLSILHLPWCSDHPRVGQKERC